MEIIKIISEQIENELDSSEKFIKMAVTNKQLFPEISQTFYNFSLEKLNNTKILHDQVIKIIKNYRATEGDPPAPMMAIYNYMHQRHINKANAIKNFQSMYKEGSV